jgi:hypothetical protein
MAKKKKPVEKAEPLQIGGAAIGAAAGAALGCLTCYMFFPNITAWLQTNGKSDRYKYLIGTIIVLLSMPIPGAIGYIGGEDKDTILSNVGYFMILYSVLILLFEDLMIPGTMDSIILGGLFIFCFYISMKFGLKTDGTLSWFWMPIIIIFALLLAVQYYFADIVRIINHGEKLWKNPEQKGGAVANADSDSLEKNTVADSLEKNTVADSLEKNTVADSLEKPRKPWLIPDFKGYEGLAEKLLAVFNSKTYPEFDPNVQMGEHLIDSNTFKARPIIPIVIIAIAGISFIISLLVEVFTKQPSDPGFNIKFQSGLQISTFLFILFCVFLILGKFVVDILLKKYPQFKAENLDPMIDNVIAVGDLSELNTLVPAGLTNELVQNGGGKITSHKPRKSKTNEKYLRVSF